MALTLVYMCAWGSKHKTSAHSNLKSLNTRWEHFSCPTLKEWAHVRLFWKEKSLKNSLFGPPISIALSPANVTCRSDTLCIQTLAVNTTTLICSLALNLLLSPSRKASQRSLLHRTVMCRLSSGSFSANSWTSEAGASKVLKSKTKLYALCKCLSYCCRVRGLKGGAVGLHCSKLSSTTNWTISTSVASSSLVRSTCTDLWVRSCRLLINMSKYG